MAALGPFEAHPNIAVAVSGGADSMALALLGEEWARARGGSVLALTVDHGLRANAMAEARQVGRWLRDPPIAHRILRWKGPKPQTGIQAAARDARYALLMARCQKEGILHLLLAHQREDQAETFFLRLAGGSGSDGLAGMSRVSERAHLRLLRPLLGVPRARLRKTLEARGQAWVEDPSNEDPAFARVRVRALLPVLDREGVTAERLGETTRQMAILRADHEGAMAALLAEHASLYPQGYARLGKAAFQTASLECARAALSGLLRVVGGGLHGPRRDRVGRLATAFSRGAFGSGHTLGGCRVLVGKESLLICREMRKAAPETVLLPGGCFHWDGRFRVEVVPAKAATAWPAKKLCLRRLGTQGWSEIVTAEPELRKNRLPAAVRTALPAIWDHRGVVRVPHLGYGRGKGPGSANILKRLDFQPLQPLAGATFTVV